MEDIKMSFSPTVSPLILLGVKGNPFMKITVINREWKLLFLLYLHFMSSHDIRKPWWLMCVLTLEHFCWEKLHKIILPQSADAMNKMEKSQDIGRKLKRWVDKFTQKWNSSSHYLLSSTKLNITVASQQNRVAASSYATVVAWHLF